MRSFTATCALSLLVLATVAGAPRAQRPDEPPPPPAPSSPPEVTRAEAEAVLASLADAWTREDRQAVEKLYDQPIAWRAARDAQKLFAQRNYFTLLARSDGEQRNPDGSLRLAVVLDLTSREVTQAHARREKRRWFIDFARRPERGVVIAFQGSAEAGLLPENPPWHEDALRGEIRLQGARQPGRSIEIDITLMLTNMSQEPASEVAFALHPFSSNLVARTGAASLAASRTEASLDAWRVTLDEAVEPGGKVELALSYVVTQPGQVAACAIEPDLVRLYAASGWLPFVEPSRAGAPAVRSHDFVVIAPEALQVSMPGRREEAASPGAGLRAARFVSERPAVETALIAVLGTREEIRLGPGLVLDVLRRQGGGDAATAVSHVTTLAAFLEDRLGPCPVSRLALAEGGAGGFREAPGWMALPTLQIAKEDADLPESDQVFLFLGLSMARLWVVHDLAPSGVGAAPIALGLCEHLVGAWADAAVKKGISERQRLDTLSFVQLDPQLDRPLLPEADDPRTPAIFKQGKARMVFDSFELLAGDQAWHDLLQAWARSVPRGAPVTALVDLMAKGDAERGRFVDAFFRRQGASQVSIADIRTVPIPADEAARLGLDPAVWKRVEIEIDNAGLGPVPVVVRLEVDQNIVFTRVIVPEYGRAVAMVHAGNAPTRVRLDPHGILWQAKSDDDAWPAFRAKRRDEFGEAETLGRSREALPSDAKRPR